MRYRSLIILLLFFTYTKLHAQLQHPLISYTDADGLSYNDVNNIQIDHLGYMWIATNYGLNKFDGKHFIRYYSPANKTDNGITGNVVTHVICDNFAVWVATANNGISYYYDEPDFFYTYVHKPTDTNSLVSNNINCLYLCHDKKVFIGTKEGLSIFNRNTSKFTNIIEHPTFKTPLDISSFTESQAAIIWIGTNRQGLLFFNKNGINAIANQPKQILSARINDLLYNETKHEVWIATTNGLWCAKEDASHKLNKWQQPFYALNNKSIECVKRNEAGELWIGTSADGLYRCTTNGNIFHFTGSTLTGKDLLSNCIKDIFFAPDGVVWLSTPVGIQCYDPDLLRFPIFKIYLHHSKTVFSSNVFGMCIYGKHIICATDYGVYISDTNFLKSHILTALDEKGKNVSFKSVTIYDGKIFIAGSDGIYELIRKQNVFVLVHSKTLLKFSKDIKSGYTNILKANNSTFWMSAFDKKVYAFNTVTGKTDSVNMQATITSLYKDKQGRMLVGGKGFAGIYSDKGTLINFIHSDKSAVQFKKGWVSDFYDDGKNIWISDCDEGLYCCDRNLQILNIYNTENGLCDNGLYCIQPDDMGRLWLTTNRGLSVFDTAAKTFSNYYSQQGLPSEEFNIYGKASSSNKTLYFSTKDGIIQVRPYTWTSLKEDSLHTQINKLVVGDKSMTENDLVYLNEFHRVSIDYGKNIILSFSAVSFLPAYNYSLQYKLNNNKSWFNISPDAEIVLPGLQPGNNKLYMRAVIKAGMAHTKPLIIILSVSTPYYRQWWFIAIICFVCSLIIYSIYRYRINQIKKMYMVRAKISRDLHDDIGSTLGSINMYTDVAAGKLKKQQPAEAEEIIKKMGIVSRQTIERMSDIIWSINPNNESFEQLKTRMQVFAALMLTPHEILFKFYIDEDAKTMKLRTEERKNIYLIYKEAIHNIVKYAACCQVEIKMTLKHKQFAISIQDNGKGYISNVHNGELLGGNGIDNMKARAKSIKACFNISSIINKGTLVELKLLK